MKNLLLSVFLMAGLPVMAQETPINIDLSKKGNVISQSLYGIFFEEINHAGDGGLYAELVQNRGFEEHVLPSSMKYENGRAVAIDSPNYEHRNNRKWSIPWDVEAKKYLGWSVKSVQCELSREVKQQTLPLHPNTPNAMQLTISSMQQGGKAQLINSGYWGMGFKDGEKYDLRFYVKSSDYKGDITARIVDDNGRDIGSVKFDTRKSDGWEEYTGVIRSTGVAAKGQLVLEFDADGTVLVDYVSLFPRHTFNGRKNGLRKDLARMLQKLHPAFMRWPGGCIVEGATYENRVKWKETLGDPMTRRGEWDVWGYRATWGMGYHEFLQFCEDLEMDAMYVCNAGMSCSVRNGDYVDGNEELDAVIQDFRDAIQYAIGDPTKNKWAKMRSDAGHPAPFPLKYVEIGNENVGPEYVKHFNYIHRVLSKEYPDIIFINTLGHTDPLLSQIPGDYMVDPHWYRNPDFFFNNNHLFDEAPRQHDIYVGEYACNAGVGGGNLLAAISEAAFILGMERNSDVVKMSSYAPLFENFNRKDWPCNLIHFNSNETYGRASYYVQQMAAENRPTYNVFVDETSKAMKSESFKAGTIGLGSYATQVEYRNIQISLPGQKKAAKYKASQFVHKKGEWQVKNGVISQTSDQQLTLSMLPGFSADNYVLTLQAKKVSGLEGFFIYYGLDESGQNGYAVNIAGWNNRTTAVQPVRRGRTNDTVSRQAAQSVENGRWYDIKIAVTPDSTVLYVDGTLVTTARPLANTRYFCQAGYDERSGELIIKVVNGTDQPYSREFSIRGAQRVEPRGRIITLSGNATDENTFAEPTKLTPKTTMFGGFGEKFKYEFAPMSFTIMRVRVSGDGLARTPWPRLRETKDPNAHDPVMAKGEDGRYYCFMTGMNVGVISSEDMITWRNELSALKETPAWARDTVPGYNGHTWAPDISYHNGQWHLYYSCSTFGKNGSAIGHAVNKTLDPKSPDFGWVDKGMVIASHRRIDNWNAIDPNLIVDQKGQPWLTYGSFWDGIQLIKLSKKDFQTPVTKPVTIARRLGRKLSLTETNNEANFTIEGGNTIEAGENAIEAPFIFYHGGYYYMFVSFDYCCRGQNSTYKTVYGRSKKVNGPYLDRNGKEMAYGGGTMLYGPDEDYFGVGHNSVYEWDGKCYFVSHAYVKDKNGDAKLFIRPLTFDKDGWIVEED
ncbi:MAG: family 43 glycosylhydrolase [Bacteroidaceae bacterium]|nr:family 43 glycosylhydrolase [Bacteroidaceae bacterium]